LSLDHACKFFYNILCHDKAEHTSDEKTWIVGFFDTIVSSTGGSNTLTCRDANQYFFPLSYPQNRQLNIIQQAFDSLASFENPEFIAMSEYLNHLKANFYHAPYVYIKFTAEPAWVIPMSGDRWTWPTSNIAAAWSAFDTLTDIIRHLEHTLYGVLEMNADDMLGLMDKTNTRIYGALSVCVNVTLCELIANDSQPKYRQYRRSRLGW